MLVLVLIHHYKQQKNPNWYKRSRADMQADRCTEVLANSNRRGPHRDQLVLAFVKSVFDDIRWGVKWRHMEYASGFSGHVRHSMRAQVHSDQSSRTE